MRTPDREVLSDRPEVIGGWLTFDDYDGEGRQWVRIDQITYMHVYDDQLDVHATSLAHADQRIVDDDDRPVDLRLDWFRIHTPNAQQVARDAALGVDR